MVDAAVTHMCCLLPKQFSWEVVGVHQAWLTGDQVNSAGSVEICICLLEGS